MTLFLMFLLIGAFIGILAGLLGVGGGAVIVPLLIYTLKAQNVANELIMQMALATSFATIVLTSISSVYAHSRKGSVLWHQAKYLTLGVVVGTLVGGMVVTHLSNILLLLIFCAFLAHTAYKMLKTKVATDNAPSIKQLKDKTMTLWGSGIGFASSFVGIGGGSLTVPFLTSLGYDVRKAIATSSTVGFSIAVVGAINGIFHSIGVTNLPPYAFGFIYLPAFAGIALTSMIFAPLGARLAYHLPVKTLRKIFGIFLLIVLVKLVHSLMMDYLATTL